MNASYYSILMTALIIMTLAVPVFGQNSAEEARKHLVRGMAAIEMSKSEDGLAAAAAEFKKATEIEPNMSSAWYNLGSVQSKMGQLKDAIASYRRYLILAPKADDARLVKDEIIKLEYKMEKATARVLKREGRYIAYVDGTVLDMRTNLMWAAKDNGTGISWEDANTYCENYRGGGYTDWRMPTPEELGGLTNADKPYQSECRGPLGGTWNIYATELIRLTCHLAWTSKLGSDNDARAIDFDRRVMPWVYKSSGSAIRVLPVRSAEPDLTALAEPPGEKLEKGIGLIGMSISDGLIVADVMRGMPAAEAGIKVGDRILKVDGKDTHGLTVQQLVGLVRGRAGSMVTVEVERQGEAKPLSFPLIRKAP